MAQQVDADMPAPQRHDRQGKEDADGHQSLNDLISARDRRREDLATNHIDKSNKCIGAPGYRGTEAGDPVKQHEYG